MEIEGKRKDTTIEIAKLHDKYASIKKSNAIFISFHHKQLADLPNQSRNVYATIIRLSTKHTVGTKILRDILPNCPPRSNCDQERSPDRHFTCNNPAKYLEFRFSTFDEALKVVNKVVNFIIKHHGRV